MVLRLPKTLLDASLLEDEPFKTCFASCRAEYSQRRRRSTPRIQHIDLVVDALGEEAGDLDAAILWITYGFNVKPTEAKDGRLLRIFVDFYWHLYFETESAACALLYTECKARNLGYRPDIHATLPSIANFKKSKTAGAASSRSSRRKRRKQKKGDDADGADVEDNSNDDHTTPSSASTAVFNTRTRHSVRIAATSTTGGGKANPPKTARKPKLPAYEPSESSLSELDSEKPVVVKPKRGRKRKSKKHGASSPSAASTDDAPKTENSTRIATTTVPGWLSDCSTLTSLTSDDEPVPSLASLSAAYNDSPAQSVRQEAAALPSREPMGTSTPARTGPVSTAAAIPAPTVPTIETEDGPASSTLDSPTLTLVTSSPPTAKGRKRKTQRGLEKPTRVMPGRVAAQKDKLTALSVQEATYHERARRGQYEDFEVNVSTVSAPAKVATGPPPALEKVDTTPAAQPTTLCADAESSSTTAPNPVKSAGRRTTVKKPRISQRMGGLAVQVAKRLRRNDGTAAPLPIGAALADVMLKSVAKPPPETPTEPLQAKKSDEGASHTCMTSKAHDVSISTAQKPRRGRKRTRAQAETQADSLQDSTPSVPPPTDRIVIRIPPRTRTSTLVASSSTPVPVYRPTVDGSVVDTVLRDAATESLETLTCTEDPASDWEVDNLDEEPTLVYESDHDIDYVRKSKKASARKPSVYNRPAPAPSECGDILPRKPLERYPPIWAESRQEVCESFDWFRSYQGGVYFIKGHVKGYLLGGFSASRDLFHDNGRLIISHGGGKAESIHKINGQSEAIEASDQREDDKSVGALLHTYRTKRPLVLLIDDKYRLFPFDISSKGCTYAILGWYHIAHAWAEYQPASNTTGKVVRYKFAFQWCEDQGQPWWGSSLQQDVLPQADVPQDEPIANRQVCSHCGGSSPTVYAQGWMCLKSECRAFYTFADGSVPPTHMTYAPGFLKPVPFSGEVLEDLFPSLPGADLPADSVTTTRHFCRGWHCKSCGRLSSRFKWEYWECRNCGERHGKYGKLRTAEEFRYQTKAKTFDRHWRHPSILPPNYINFVCGKAFGTKVTFVLPHGRGRIYLLLSHPLANKPADEILTKYQEEAQSNQLLFRRWPMRAHKCRGTLLTNYFSQNTGAPYQYVGGDANTVPFDRAPSAVVSALELINTRMQQAELGKVGFNEVLSAAYMEEQRMAFHSDSERGLGPTVASLSLGASAYMHFRLHARHAAEEMGDGSREVLKLFLRHGDVVVMEGAGVQECYEHTVVPLNFRIAATARLIGSEHH